MAKKATAAKKQQRTMSDEHKAALAVGRVQGRLCGGTRLGGR
jgi:hypothetical protein